MVSDTIDAETAAPNYSHLKLERWVEEVTRLCKPERVQWCDGSPEEYQALLRLMILTGSAIPLDPVKRPNSVLVGPTRPMWPASRTGLLSAHERRRRRARPITGKIRRR